MKSLQFLRLPLASLFIFSLVGIAADAPDPGTVQISVGSLLEQGHYSRKKLDDKFSQELLKNYLDASITIASSSRRKTSMGSPPSTGRRWMTTSCSGIPSRPSRSTISTRSAWKIAWPR